MATFYNNSLPDLGNLQTGDTLLFGDKINEQNQAIQDLIGAGAVSPYIQNNKLAGVNIIKPYIKPGTQYLYNQNTLTDPLTGQTYQADPARPYLVGQPTSPSPGFSQVDQPQIDVSNPFGSLFNQQSFENQLPTGYEQYSAQYQDLLNAQKQALEQSYQSSVADIGTKFGQAKQETKDVGGRTMGTLNRILGRAGGFTTTAGGQALAGKETEIQGQLNQLATAEQSALSQAKAARDSGNLKLLGDYQDRLFNIQKEIQNVQQQRTTNLLSLLDKMTGYEQKQQQQQIDLTKLNVDLAKFDYTQRQDLIQNQLNSDKFTWQQKQDLINNQLNQNKFTYQQNEDAKNYYLKLQQYQLDVVKASAQDTPQNYKEWQTAGGLNSGKTYEQFLLEKGKVSGKPPTADQLKNAEFATSMKFANDTITALTKAFEEQGLAGQVWGEKAPNFLKTNTQQLLKQANEQFVNAILRRESGAAVPEQEYTRYASAYLPQPGDSKETLKAKATARSNRIKSLVNSAGSALSQDFVGNIDKTFYPDLQTYIDTNPDKTDYVKSIRNTYPDWSPDEVLQYLQDESPQSFNSVGSDTKSAMRTDRHNNPTAMTTDLAKQAGLKEGIDYVAGDKFAGGITAKFLKDPIAETIKVIDKLGFYTQGGGQRWKHTAMSKNQWDKLAYADKKEIIKKMYQKEGGSSLLKLFA